MSDPESFEDLLKELDRSNPKTRQEPKVGERVSGTLVSIGEDYAFVDLGAKTEGRMEVALLRNPEGELTAQVGDRVEAAVSGKDSDTGTLLLGSQHGGKLHGLDEVRRAFQEGLPVQGQVTGAVKGGLEVQIAGVRAFCPASQADIRFMEDLSELVGQRLDFRVTKLEGGKRPNLVVSRRALLEEEQRIRAEQIRAELKEGAVLSGTVTSLKDYGAFVDLGGIEGMIHVSELAFGRVKHPSEVLSVGQPVEVAVLRIEPGQPGKEGGKGGGRPRDKIALSIRALSRDPWADAERDYPVGSRVSGTVSRVQPFGAFVELAPGIDGLVHISELGAERRVNHPGEILNPGDPVEATVLSVDLARRRIALTIAPGRAGAGEPAELREPPPGEGRRGPGRDDSGREGRREQSRPGGRDRGRPGGPERAQGRGQDWPQERDQERPQERPQERQIGSFGALLQESLKKGR
jgi:small subunit ribosomal protein S1